MFDAIDGYVEDAIFWEGDARFSVSSMQVGGADGGTIKPIPIVYPVPQQFYNDTATQWEEAAPIQVKQAHNMTMRSLHATYPGFVYGLRLSVSSKHANQKKALQKMRAAAKEPSGDKMLEETERVRVSKRKMAGVVVSNKVMDRFLLDLMEVVVGELLEPDAVAFCSATNP